MSFLGVGVGLLFYVFLLLCLVGVLWLSRGFLNRCLLFFSRCLRLSKPWGVPSSVTLETSSVCNLGCPLCPQGCKVLGRRMSFMSLESFRLVVDQLPSSTRLMFSGYGEPFLTPGFLDMMEYAKSKGFGDVTVSTNGNIVLKDGEADRLVNSGITKLLVAFDGFDQESYVKYRVGGDFNKLCTFVREVCDAKKRNNSNIYVVVQQHLFSHNEAFVDTIRELALGLGADRFQTKVVQDFTSRNEERLKELGGKKEKRKKSLGVWFDLWACPDLWYFMYVNSEGFVTTCDMDGYNNFVYGGNYKNLVRSWRHDLAKFRDMYKKDKMSIKICESCVNKRLDV